MERKIEILAPAGSWECMEAAICAGADAVYMGGARFGARAYADNFGQEDLLRAIDHVHLHGRKLYLTVNTLLKNREMDELYAYLLPYYRQGVDAVIVQDVGVMRMIKKVFPDLPIHISTQAAVTGASGARFFQKAGAQRVVPAREISLPELRQIKEETGMELECFVHGAMCYCYSGQCLFSSLIGGRSGNRGQCAQPCRLPYRAGGKKGDLLSMKDLASIEWIPDLVDAGVDSFKIEGRMKQPDYVYTVAGLYRKYTDLYLREGRDRYVVSDADRQELVRVYQRRGYTDGYFKRHNGKEMISLEQPKYRESGAPELALCERKEKINGKLILSEGKRVKLGVEYKIGGNTYFVEEEGEVVQKAQKAPLDRQRVEKQIRKTGNTEFVFASLEIRMDGQVFLPMQALNELRRDVLQKLEEKVTGESRRFSEAPENADGKIKRSGTVSQAADLSLMASVQTKEQLASVLQVPEVCAVFVEGICALEKETLRLLQTYETDGRCRKYFAMPHIFRRKTQEQFEAWYGQILEHYDGVLIRNWESYEWLCGKGYPKSMIADHNLYVFNKSAKAFMQETRIEEYTVSPELNAGEIRNLGPGGILSVYGYQPVMIAANCIQKTTAGCRRDDAWLKLTDRRNKTFAVKCFCSSCYNVIYNCAPLVLFDLPDEIRETNVSAIRLDFTTEQGEEAGEILARCKRSFYSGQAGGPPEGEYTRGHFKRGVK